VVDLRIWQVRPMLISVSVGRWSSWGSVAGLVVLVSAAAVWSSSTASKTPSRPATASAAIHTTSTPPAVLNAVQNAGSWDGDPHPQELAQWVLTTNHAASPIMDGEVLPDSDYSIYLVQIQGRFPSCPPCTGLLPQPPGTVIVLTIPVDGSVDGSGFSFGNKVNNFSTLGPVHTFRL